MKAKTQENPKRSVNHKVISFFLLGFPILLIGVADNLLLKVLLILYELVVLKQFIDNYYEYS